MGGAIVQIEGVGNVQFPASMSDDEISQASHRLYTGAGAKAISDNPPGVPKPAEPEMEKSNLGTALNPTESVASPGEASYAAQADPESQARMLGAAAIGAGGTSGIIPKIARAALPFAVPSAATYAINKAKQLPVIGPIINKIPFAEALPWLAIGKGNAGKIGEAAEAEGATAAAEAEGAVAAEGKAATGKINPTPEILAKPAALPTQPIPSGANLPRTLSGESALNQILTGQDNVNLMKIAKSRGINVSQEAQLKPGYADNKIIRKIIDDFSPDELDNIRSTYAESTRNRHDFGDVGPEAWKTMSLKTYFPNLKISGAAEKRTAAAIAGAKKPAIPAIDEDLTPILKQSLARVKARQ